MTFKEKYYSIDQSKLPEKAKVYMEEFKKDTKNFTDKEAMKIIMPTLDGFIKKLKESGYESAIKTSKTEKPKKEKVVKKKTAKEMVKEIVEEAVEQPKTTKGQPKMRTIKQGDYMRVAKEIRKEGEPWKDALKRAKEFITTQKEVKKEEAKRQYQKLKEFIEKQPEYYPKDIPTPSGGRRGTTLERDAVRVALPKGKRISKKTGKTYYEYRSNRIDKRRDDYPYLAKGGEVDAIFGDGGMLDRIGDAEKLLKTKKFNTFYEKLGVFKKEYSKNEIAKILTSKKYNSDGGLLFEIEKDQEYIKYGKKPYTYDFDKVCLDSADIDEMKRYLGNWPKATILRWIEKPTSKPREGDMYADGGEMDGNLVVINYGGDRYDGGVVWAIEENGVQIANGIIDGDYGVDFKGKHYDGLLSLAKGINAKLVNKFDSDEYADGGEIPQRESLKYFIMNEASTGSIANKVPYSSYDDIKGVRWRAYQILLRDGDKKYSLQAYIDLIKQAVEEYEENKYEMSFADGGTIGYEGYMCDFYDSKSKETKTGKIIKQENKEFATFFYIQTDDGEMYTKLVTGAQHERLKNGTLDIMRIHMGSKPKYAKGGELDINKYAGAGMFAEGGYVDRTILPTGIDNFVYFNTEEDGKIIWNIISATNNSSKSQKARNFLAKNQGKKITLLDGTQVKIDSYGQSSRFILERDLKINNGIVRIWNEFRPKYWYAKGGELEDFYADGGMTKRMIALPVGTKEQIEESIRMGYDTLVEGMISPKTRGVMLIDKDSNVRGTYPMLYKGAIEEILHNIKGYAKGGELDINKYAGAGMFADGGEMDTTPKKLVDYVKSTPKAKNILKAVYESRIDALKGEMDYYEKGADRYYHEQVRGDVNDEIERISRKMDEVRGDIDFLEDENYPIDLVMSGKSYAISFLNDLNDLIRTKAGRKLFDSSDESSNNEYFDVYYTLYDLVDETFESYKDKGSYKYAKGGEVYGNLRKRFEGYTDEELQIFNGDNEETLKNWNREDAIEEAIHSVLEESDEYAKGGYTTKGEDYEYVNTFGVAQNDFEEMVDAWHKTDSYDQMDRIESRLVFRRMTNKYGEEKVEEINKYIWDTHNAHEHSGEYAKGGSVGNKMSFEEFEETLQEYEIEGGFGKTLEKGYKMYYLPSDNPLLNTKFPHRNKKKAYQEYLKMDKYAKGGKIGFKGLSDKVAKYYTNKKVPSKYQNLYGKTYDKKEAKEVGDKVASKVYYLQKSKMAKGGEISVYNLRKGDKVKTRKGDIETIIRKTGSGSYETIENDYTHSPESLEFISRPSRKKMAKGGEVGNTTHEKVTLIFDGKEHKYDMVFVDGTLEDVLLPYTSMDTPLFNYLEKEFDDWLEYAGRDYEAMYFSDEAIYSKRGAIRGAMDVIEETISDDKGKKKVYNLDKGEVDFMSAFS